MEGTSRGQRPRRFSRGRLSGVHNPGVLAGSELWLLRLMADRGLALLDADSLLMVIEERGELRVAAGARSGPPRLRIAPVEGSALGALYQAGVPVAVERPRGQDAAWLHELGLEARAALVEPFSM